jgi:hypothetical protein
MPQGSAIEVYMYVRKRSLCQEYTGRLFFTAEPEGRIRITIHVQQRPGVRALLRIPNSISGNQWIIPLSTPGQRSGVIRTTAIRVHVSSISNPRSCISGTRFFPPCKKLRAFAKFREVSAAVPAGVGLNVSKDQRVRPARAFFGVLACFRDGWRRARSKLFTPGTKRSVQLVVH